MDNLTHTLTGVVLSRLGLSRLTPRATWICLVGANIPDIDLVAASSAINYLNYHRHLTHALPAVPLMAALTLALVELPRLLVRPKAKPLHWRRAWVVAGVAALSHPLLDLANSYGVRIWLPFSNRWHSWDIFFVIDLWVWGILLIAALGPMLAGLIHQEIGAPKVRGRGLALAGLAALGMLMGGKALLHQRAVAMLNAHLYDGAPAVRAAAFPLPFGWNPFAWSGFVETRKGYLIPVLDVRRPYDPASARRFYKAPPSPALEAAWNSPIGRDYSRFARYSFAQVDQTPEGYIVQFADFRFRRGDSFGFRCTIEMDEAYRIVREQFQF